MSKMRPRRTYPLPIRPEIVDITPDMASDWLETRRWEGQRKTSHRKVEHLAEAMRRPGGFRETHQGIAFDTDGYQIDGYHRLEAVRLAGVTVRMWVFPDMPRDTFDVIDTGYARAAAQFLPSVAPAMAAGSLRYISAATDKDFPGIYRNKMTLHESIELHRQWPEVENWALAVWGARSVAKIPPSPLLAIVSMGERGGVDPKIISDFLTGLKSGAIGDSRDPRLLLRNRFIRDQKALSGGRMKTHVYALLVKGFNAFAKDERPGRLIYTEGDHIPLPLGVTWGGERITPRSEAA